MHLILPIIFTAALFPKLEKKYLLGLFFCTFLMDFDIFIGTTHRFLFHNLLFVILVSGIVYFAWNKKAFFVALFYTGSHLIFDLGKPGVAFLWPIINRTFYVTADILRDTSWIVNFSVGSVTRAEYLRDVATLGPARWMTINGFAVALLLAVLVVVRYRKEIKSSFSR